MCSKHVSQKRNFGMRPLIIANGTKCYSILYCNSPWLYIRLKYTYSESAISVKLDSLPAKTKKQGIDLFVAFGVRLVHSWADKNTNNPANEKFVAFGWSFIFFGQFVALIRFKICERRNVRWDASARVSSLSWQRCSLGRAEKWGPITLFLLFATDGCREILFKQLRSMGLQEL